jgi:hemolysin III
LQRSHSLSESLSTPSKPAWRGVLHGWAFYLAIPAGVTVSLFADNPTARAAAAVFAGAVVIMFGASALYHRFTWSPGVRSWLRRLDHLGIFGLIAGTYTAYGLLVLDHSSRIVVLAVVWSGAAAVVILKFVWVAAPKWISVVTGVLLGWVAIAVFPQLIHRGGLTPSMLTLGAGVLYTLGAIVYARRKPDPMPTVFGYHELFHALVVAAVGLQYAAVGSLVLR